MNYYGAKEMGASFRTVRKNTITIAEEIPEKDYGFRATPDTQSVSELLTHMAFAARFQVQVNLIEKRTSMVGFEFMKFFQELKADQAKPRNKAELIALLTDEGEKFASAIEALSDEFLGEIVSMPPGGNPPSRSRFDMLGSAKEHEMHHRGQLMLMERLLGITPHLTRQNQARMAAMQAAMAKAEKH